MKIKKLKTTLPIFVDNKIKSDIVSFSISKNKLLNIIFEYYMDKKLYFNNLESFNGKILQFNLNKNMDLLYDDEIESNKIKSEAQYLRDIIFNYSNLPKYKREEIIFKKSFEILYESIEDKIKIKFIYNKKLRNVEPLFLISGDRDSRNYLYCYCLKSEEYRVYKVRNIESVRRTIERIEKSDYFYASQVKENFDPFLSYGREVVVKLNDTGKRLLDVIVENRPKVLKVDDDIYTFECAIKKAQVYFPQFLSNMEVLEPQILREWFIKEYKKAYEVYKEERNGE